MSEKPGEYDSGRRPDVNAIATEARIRNLALSFQALLGAPGVDPWDALKLDQWAEGRASSGERQAARFVLSVWNRHDWGKQFILSEAMRVWDEKNLNAFREWVKAPWWA